MAVYYLTMKNSGKSSSAVMKYDYNAREGFYKKGSKAEELIYKISENMPEWGKNNPRYFWKMVDEHERANANLFRKIEFSLPHELTDEENIKLANEYVKELLGEDFPYSISIHKKLNEEKTLDNIHCHLIFCERKIDGIERNEEHFFKRSNSKNPEKGGAKKYGDLYWAKKDTLYYVREKWEERLNEKLEEKGIEKVSCKSLKKQREAAIKSNDFLKADLLDREPINIDMIGSNKIKKQILEDDELLLKAKYLLSKEIKIMKEEEYAEKLTDPRGNDKAREEFMVRNIGSTDVESNFVIDKNLDIEIYKAEIERQIEKEELYKNIAVANKKIENIEKQKDEIRANIKELKKVISETIDPEKKMAIEKELKEEINKSKKVFGMSNIYQMNIKKLEEEIKKLNAVSFEIETINKEKIQEIKKECEISAKEFNERGDKKAFYKELRKIKQLNSQIKEIKNKENITIIDEKIKWLENKSLVFNLDYKNVKEPKEPIEKIVDWDIVFNEKIKIKEEKNITIDKLEIEFEKQILKEKLYKKIAEEAEFKEKTLRQIERLEKIDDPTIKYTTADLISYKNKLEIKINSLKQNKEILEKIPQKEAKKYLKNIKNEIFNGIKKIKRITQLIKLEQKEKTIEVNSLKEKIKKINEINNKIVEIERSSDIKIIRKEIYDGISSGRYSKIMDESKELSTLILRRKTDNAVKGIKIDPILDKLEEKKKEYIAAIDKFIITNPVEGKIKERRDGYMQKLEELKNEKQNIVILMKNNKKYNNDPSILDLLAKEEKFNKGRLDTSNIIETGNER